VTLRFTAHVTLAGTGPLTNTAYFSSTNAGRGQAGVAIWTAAAYVHYLPLLVR
jgi:hypothetical protein